MAIRKKRGGGGGRRKRRRRRPKLTAQQILDRFEDVSPSDNDGQYMATCPAHDDGTASLSIRVVEDRVLLYCHAGCETEEVLEAADLKMSDLFIADSGMKEGE